MVGREAGARAEQAITVARTGILAVLEARGLPCPEDVRARIEGCAVPAILERWLVRAISATSASAVVEGG